MEGSRKIQADFFLNELTFVARDRTLVTEVSFWSLAKRKTPEIMFTQISNLRKRFAYRNFVSISAN